MEQKEVAIHSGDDVGLLFAFFATSLLTFFQLVNAGLDEVNDIHDGSRGVYYRGRKVLHDNDMGSYGKGVSKTFMKVKVVSNEDTTVCN